MITFINCDLQVFPLVTAVYEPDPTTVYALTLKQYSVSIASPVTVRVTALLNGCSVV